MAIVRPEQLYPFPVAELNDVLASWPELLRMDLVAGRARNRGAWRQIRHELAALKINTLTGSMQAARQRQPGDGYGRT